jgi:AraC family transcriptional regulator, ethanolamine operon transcriptional activator
MSPSPDPLPFRAHIVEAQFDDIDAMAASPLAWDQQYEQIGRGRFQGHITQVMLNSLQVGRVIWSPGVLQRGSAPTGTWVFGLPIAAEGSLHVRRRPAPPGALLAATSRDDVGFSATGRTDLMVVVLPTPRIDHWVQQRRGIDKFDVDLPSRHWQVSPAEMSRRAGSLIELLQALKVKPHDCFAEHALLQIEEKIFDVILDMIPSAEVIEPLHNRARIARTVLEILDARRDNPPSVTELCAAAGARERTLYLSCMEAFGRPPAKLLTELRLNAAHRALLRSGKGTRVAAVAALYGFNHFGRFAESYRRQFGELPSVTCAKVQGTA